ncbi:unnamed protein product [Nippostrongylus brasiliensis]|uniref:T-box domain-containing protein n=1 Tax=Nippostrongylus brasiliensis TaxID=27835 RepID=A0A0N4YZ91_NIPBR|nr:unnamed protein product [Nippostrongylus brasiliensis]
MVDYPSTISATLTTESLWRKFHKHTTEMIVTKSGRKIFPKIEYKLHGLNPDDSYAIMLHIERVDDMRYKFSAGDWSTNGKGEARTPSRSIPHHDGAVDTGRSWMSKTVAFDRVKVTNNQQDHDPFHSGLAVTLIAAGHTKSYNKVIPPKCVPMELRTRPVKPHSFIYHEK